MALGRVIRSFLAPTTGPSGLAFDDRWLWCCDRDEDIISQIDPETGREIRRFATGTTLCSGLTFDGRTLWFCDYTSGLIYQVTLKQAQL